LLNTAQSAQYELFAFTGTACSEYKPDWPSCINITAVTSEGLTPNRITFEYSTRTAQKQAVCCKNKSRLWIIWKYRRLVDEKTDILCGSGRRSALYRAHNSSRPNAMTKHRRWSRLRKRWLSSANKRDQQFMERVKGDVRSSELFKWWGSI
jgi:hypothetical protein